MVTITHFAVNAQTSSVFSFVIEIGIEINPVLKTSTNIKRLRKNKLSPEIEAS